MAQSRRTIKDGYDFTFSFGPAGIVQQIPPAAKSEGSEANDASDPSGGLSLFDALNKQLGLKLETVKRQPDLRLL